MPLISEGVAGETLAPSPALWSLVMLRNLAFVVGFAVIQWVSLPRQLRQL